MHTYRIYSNSKQKLVSLTTHPLAVKSAVVRFRLLLVTKKELTEEDLEGVTVKDYFQGDCFETLYSWVGSNIVEELHSEHQNLPKTPTTGQKHKAVEKWIRAKAQIVELEKQVDEAKEHAHECAKEMVRFFGKGPISIDGEIYDPSYVRELVVYLHRREQVKAS